MSTETQAYEHSTVFSQMKSVKESIQGNLTTHQYLRALDSYLTKAIEVLFCLNDNFRPFLLQLLAWQELNPKRKVSLLAKEDFRIVAVRFLSGDLKSWEALKLDRLLVVQYVESQLAYYQKLLDVHNGVSGLEDVYASHEALSQATIGMPPVATPLLLDSLRSSRYWLSAATEFKNQVLEKYYRLCLRTAQQDYVDFFKKRVKLDDVIQVYVQAASRALDKCDATQGVLTTHVQYWLYTARTNVLKSLPAEHSLEETYVNDNAADEDEPTTEDSVALQEDTEAFAELLAVADPSGAARAYLGINETAETLRNTQPYIKWRLEC